MTAILISIVVPTSKETFVISYKLLHSLLMEVCVLQFQPRCHVIMTLKFA